MDLGLAGRHVLITGGSKGIGLACARAFLDERAKVSITSRMLRNLDDARARLGDTGVFAVAANLSDAADALRMIEACEAAHGPVDVLVNCAGAARRRPPDELDPAAYGEAMEAKYLPYVNVMDPVVKRMAARHAGVVVNVIGNGGRVASPIHLAGGAANAALMLVTAGLAAAYARRGVRVIGVNPALTKTERVADGLRADAKMLGISEAEALRRSEERIGMGRMAEPEEIAQVVAFVASARASYLSGTTITMDGVQYPTVV
jgi:NAD(P)-dependent dehydrogenase (short-subunit alcohol dehydrogenase family)